MRFAKIALGGTFDTIHAGHEYLLTTAFETGQKAVIGLTTDEYVRTRKTGHIQPYTARKHALEVWLDAHGYIGRYEIAPIDESVGPASKPEYEAIIVSTETLQGAVDINEHRKYLGVAPLEIITVPYIPAVDGKPISSTRIRNGEIDSSGNLIMPESMRGDLALPLGEVLTNGNTDDVIRSDAQHTVISVGDRTTARLLSLGVIPVLSIIDLHVERKPFQSLEAFGFPVGTHIKRLLSGPGFISSEAREAILQWTDRLVPTVLVVEGEEDLLTLPAVMYAPDGAILYYGQPGRGLVRVVCTHDLRQQATVLLRRFSSVTG